MKRMAVCAAFVCGIVTVLLLSGCPTPTPTTVAAPTFLPAAGSYNTDQSVTISCVTAGAAIYYTMDGSTPTTASTAYSAAIPVAGDGTTKTITAIAALSGSVSTAASATYVIDYSLISTPQISPAAGTYTTDQSVAISCATSGATIYYTTDGTAPTTSSTAYNAPIPVAGPATTETIKAIAAESGMTSAAATAAFTIAYPVGVVGFSAPAGSTTRPRA